MIRLKELLNEEIHSDDVESWTEYLAQNDYNCPVYNIEALVEKYSLRSEPFFHGKIIKLTDDKVSLFLEFTQSSNTYDLIQDINQWVYDATEDSVDITVDELWNGWIDGTLGKFKVSPSKVYHYTTPEKYELIKSSGKMIGSHGTGITNRYAFGIFTTVNIEEYQDETYGNICLELDLPRFKLDSNLQSLDLEYEPDISEYILREYIISKLELDENLTIPSDMSPYTLIVRHTIPIQYIRHIE